MPHTGDRGIPALVVRLSSAFFSSFTPPSTALAPNFFFACHAASSSFLFFFFFLVFSSRITPPEADAGIAMTPAQFSLFFPLDPSYFDRGRRPLFFLSSPLFAMSRRNATPLRNSMSRCVGPFFSSRAVSPGRSICGDLLVVLAVLLYSLV